MAWAPQQENMPGTASDVRSNGTATSLAALHARVLPPATCAATAVPGSLRGTAARESACLKNPT
jgi:hypothetical protein